MVASKIASCSPLYKQHSAKHYYEHNISKGTFKMDQAPYGMSPSQQYYTLEPEETTGALFVVARTTSETTSFETLNVPPDVIITTQALPGLRYLKWLRPIPYLTPRHFGLTQWYRLFNIPDHWMRKIYKDEVYRDTELPEPKPEVLSDEQRRILYEYLVFDSPIKDHYSPPQAESARKKRAVTKLCDDLVDLLSKPIEYGGKHKCDRNKREFDIFATKAEREKQQFSTTEEDSKQPKIPILYGHKIQPESVIVERAVNKMNKLSKAEEALFQDLLQEEKNLQFLQARIAFRLGEDTTSTQASSARLAT